MNITRPDLGNEPRARRRANLRRLLSPRHVAFVGGQSVVDPIKLCRRAGFAGEIWAVNPRHAELAGAPCFPSLADLPAPPDATFIGVPREITVEIVRQLAALGGGGCVAYAAGFAEVGETALQAALAEAAGDLAVVGPNCYGLLNCVDGVALWPSGWGGGRVTRGVAAICQSGNIALNLTMNDRSVPFAYVVSAGNQAVLGIEDYIAVFAETPAVSAIALYIEGLADVPGFTRAAATALERGVPIVALKAGRSALGAELALSHTSSLAGSDALYDALFDRLGVVRVDSVPQLLETVKYLSVAGAAAGNRLCAFTCSGGDSLLVADAASRTGVAMPAMSMEQAAAVRALLPDFASVMNPLDYNVTLWGDRDGLTRCFSAVLGQGYDAGMLVIDFPQNDPDGYASCEAAADAAIAAHRATGKPMMVASSLPELLPGSARDRLIAAGVPAMQGIDEAVAGFAAAARFGARRRQIMDAGGAADLTLPPVAAIAAGPEVVGEWESKQALAAFGLVAPAARLARPGEVAAAATSLGYPMVLKLARPVLAHKTEAGAVKLGLAGAADLTAAVAEMGEALGRARPAVAPEVFLIERMAPKPVAELIIGVKRDPQFGLALVVGAGGVLVEMAQDAATLLLPTDRASVEQALRGLKIARIIAGYRGGPAGDMDAAIDAVMAVAAFAEAERHRLVELDVNPLFVLPTGQGAVAVDALIVRAAG